MYLWTQDLANPIHPPHTRWVFFCLAEIGSSQETCPVGKAVKFSSSCLYSIPTNLPVYRLDLTCLRVPWELIERSLTWTSCTQAKLTVGDNFKWLAIKGVGAKPTKHRTTETLHSRVSPRSNVQGLLKC